MNKILNQFIRLSDGDLINNGYCIVQKTKDNTYFPDHSFTQAAEKALEDFHTAFINASGGDSMMVAIKNEKKAGLCTALKNLADYVTRISNGDLVMLLSSGFDLSASKGDKVLLPIASLEVELGSPGEVTTRIKRVVGARAYVHQYTTEQPTSDTKWITKSTTEREYKFTGLQSAAKCWFQVIALGSKGQEVASPIVARIIQ